MATVTAGCAAGPAWSRPGSPWRRPVLTSSSGGCRTSASRGRGSQGASTASTSTKYGQYIYVVAASDLVLVRLGWDVGYRHWPQLLSDLARRLNESASGKAS